MPYAAENKKKSQQNPSKDPLDIKSSSIPKRVVRDYLVSVSKTYPLVGAAKTEANKVLGSPLMVSTRRVEPTTSKVMVLEKVPVLAKSRFEKGAKKPVSNSLEHFYERREQVAFLVMILGFSIKMLL